MIPTSEKNLVLISRLVLWQYFVLYYLWLITHFDNKTVGFGQWQWRSHNRYTRTDIFFPFEDGRCT
jgi:hypothetical protein